MSRGASSEDAVRAERARIVAENTRRRHEVDAGRYAPWQAAEIFMRQGRARRAAQRLHALGVFPREGDAVLEVGSGEGGWLPELLGWRLAARDLWGVDLDLGRVATARRRLPSARWGLADATALPFAAGSFALVVISTVLSSILDPAVQEQVAREMARVVRGDGAVLCYDFAIDNPRNPHVRGLSRRRLRALFPGWREDSAAVTLAPPLARLLAPRAWALAGLLECLPFLRTHRLAVLRSASSAQST